MMKRCSAKSDNLQLCQYSSVKYNAQSFIIIITIILIIFLLQMWNIIQQQNHV